ncbi:MAG: hypothetical protein ABI824_12765 [Acidobacteriota bacterium]
MRIFLTKVFGFSEPCGPLQFNSKGLRDNALEKLKDGDRVILVGTQNRETTNEADRGRILGMMEPSRELVSYLDYSLERISSDTKASGEYRWPFGLGSRNAWAFDPKPLLSEVIHRHFDIDSAVGIVALSDQEADAVLSQTHRPIALLTTLLGRIEDAERTHGRNAPLPTTTRRGVMHMRHEPAHTYAMKILGSTTPSFKIGWAFNYGRRQREFNLYALPSLGGLKYELHLSQKWDTAKNAYLMEQDILKRFESHRHRHNSEIICQVSEPQIQSIWTEVFLERRRRVR